MVGGGTQEARRDAGEFLDRLDAIWGDVTWLGERARGTTALKRAYGKSPPMPTGILIKKGSDDVLVLASEDARKEFLRRLESFKEDRDVDLETWWMFKQHRS